MMGIFSPTSTARFVWQPGQIVAKHLPGKHDQKTHGRGSVELNLSGSMSVAAYDKVADSYRESLTDNEANALQDYGSSFAENSFKKINADLRNGVPNSAVEYIDSAIEKGKLSRSVTVGRRIDPAILASKKVGDTFTSKSYVSTSLNMEYALKDYGTGPFATVVVKLPAGTNAAVIKKGLSTRKEQEVLLARNTGFRIGRISTMGNAPVYHVELI